MANDDTQHVPAGAQYIWLSTTYSCSNSQTHSEGHYLKAHHNQYLGLTFLNWSKISDSAHCKVWGLYDMTCAKMAEPMETSFGSWTWVGPRKRVLDGAQTPT